MEYLNPSEKNPYDSVSAPVSPQKSSKRVVENVTKSTRINRRRRSRVSVYMKDSELLQNNNSIRSPQNSKVFRLSTKTRTKERVKSHLSHRKDDFRPKKRVNKFIQLFVPDNHYLVPAKTFIAPRRSYLMHLEKEKKQKLLVEYLNESMNERKRGNRFQVLDGGGIFRTGTGLSFAGRGSRLKRANRKRRRRKFRNKYGITNEIANEGEDGKLEEKRKKLLNRRNENLMRRIDEGIMGYRDLY